ncbi:nucleoside phosphorylase domain-containing protein [Microdochium trichocladiopsis]|uniref:Nucleoside phosphorylase domain-containing protein n=1 Tax=Microdochium trichocladiopsis TaxID=1682393 RepID=A0A9P8XQS1_9PEZI|nr:nucleoside phosphorylase domain-containing protein [Microdochium trichocladiopsis]KAH7012291.1 nucleoside phosphorylase domain-containing protein [Microdochium trichocladiopsis]
MAQWSGGGALARNKRALDAPPAPEKKRRTRVETLTRDNYNIGWVSALPIQLAASVALLDDRHEPLPKLDGDSNAYFYGTIGGHNVVMAHLPNDLPGSGSAANVAANMCRSFKNLRFLLLVEIGGGIPRTGHDIRLGDVVVGRMMIQHELGKEDSGDGPEDTGVPYMPPRDIKTTLSAVKVRAEMGQNPLPRLLDELEERGLVSNEYFDRKRLEDHLFKEDYDHPDETQECDKCDIAQRVQRIPRQSVNLQIHYGMIASGSQVIKNPKVRDDIGRRHQALCVETEATGLIHNFPFLAICGICTYADSHKNERWQKYAAMTAASYGIEFLRNCQPVKN